MGGGGCLSYACESVSKKHGISLSYFNTNIPGYNLLVSELRDIFDRNKNNIGGEVAIWVDDQLEFEVLNSLSFCFKDLLLNHCLLRCMSIKLRLK